MLLMIDRPDTISIQFRADVPGGGPDQHQRVVEERVVAPALGSECHRVIVQRIDDGTGPSLG
jgi:hypothetical protein